MHFANSILFGLVERIASTNLVIINCEICISIFVILLQVANANLIIIWFISLTKKVCYYFLPSPFVLYYYVMEIIITLSTSFSSYEYQFTCLFVVNVQYFILVGS
ncbi:hypothetical protein ABFS82_02G122900 [Erythranthe guttata]